MSRFSHFRFNTNTKNLKNFSLNVHSLINERVTAKTNFSNAHFLSELEFLSAVIENLIKHVVSELDSLREAYEIAKSSENIDSEVKKMRIFSAM